MPFCEARLAKLLFIQRPCKDCGSLVSLNNIGIEAIYSVKGESTRKFSDGERTNSEIIFVLGGKCRCGTENVVKFTLNMLDNEAIKLMEEADQMGVEDKDVIVSVHPVSRNPGIN
jgi:hypothetical protein